MRFDATIHPGRGSKDLSRLEDVPLDRIPDRYNRIRALVTAEECAQLLELGFEVRLHRAHPVRPLDSRLVASDESVQRWLDERLAGFQPGGTRTSDRKPGATTPGRKPRKG